MTWSASAASLIALSLAGAAVTSGVASRREAAATAQHPPLGRFVEVEGTPIHYVRRGTGPELVLIHGAGGNLRDFHFSFLDRVAQGFTVTAFDRPGLGHSGRGPGAPTGALAFRAETVAEQARLLRGAAARLGIRRPVVLGHSFGGAVALAWALLDAEAPSPASAAAIVPVATVAMPWPGALGPLYRVNGTRIGGAVVVPALTAFASDRRITTAIAGSFSPQVAPPGYAEHLGGRLTLRRPTLRANMRQLNTLRPQIVAMSEHYGALSLPVEVVHGTRDRVTPIELHGAPLAEAAPGARLTTLEGVGHMPHHVSPETVVAAVGRARDRAGG